MLRQAVRLTEQAKKVLGFDEEDEPHPGPDAKLRITVTSGCATMKKDSKGIIGISVGGGAPTCPALYIVQVFDGTPAAEDGSLEAGDELTKVNRVELTGLTTQQAARLLRSFPQEVTIHYNKLHADPSQGKTLDIALKKMKHRIVESMASDTADVLGLSRAVLQKDPLVPKLQEIADMERFYISLITRLCTWLRAHAKLYLCLKEVGMQFCNIGARETNPMANITFTELGNLHRSVGDDGLNMVYKVKPMLWDLKLFVTKVIPDLRMTLKKYLDVKFEYLSYCLKIKEMDDEVHEAREMGLNLKRSVTGNYEFRLILRCRQLAKKRFTDLRSDVLTKMELLDLRRVQDMLSKLTQIEEIQATHSLTAFHLAEKMGPFNPIDVDISNTYKYNVTGQLPRDDGPPSYSSIMSSETKAPRSFAKDNEEATTDQDDDDGDDDDVAPLDLS